MTEVTKHPTEAKPVEHKPAEHKTVERKPAEHKHAKAGPLSPAGASGDPAVQKALAELQTAQMNRDALVVVDKAELDAADEAVEKAKKVLAELGHE